MSVFEGTSIHFFLFKSTEDLFNNTSPESTKRSCNVDSAPMDIGFLVGGYNTETCETRHPDFFQTLKFVKEIAKKLRVSKTGEM